MLDAPKPEADGRSTRWESHKARRRAEVIEAAVAAIEADGLDIGVKQIAGRVGVPRSVVYRHFKDRADLDEQIRQHVVELLMVRLAPTLRPGGTVMEAIRRAIDAYLDWIEHHPLLHAFLGKGMSRAAGASPAVVGTKTAIAADVGHLFAAVLRRHRVANDLASSIAFGLVGFVDATVNHWLADRDRTLTAAELAALISRSIWHVLDGNLRALGIELDPDTPVADLLDASTSG